MNKETNDTPRLLNTTGIKAHALNVSREMRASKFERVGQDFLDGVEADVETLVRALNNASPIPDGFKTVEHCGQLVTGAMADKLNEAMNAAVARIIQRRVHRHPSIGKTLMG